MPLVSRRTRLVANECEGDEAPVGGERHTSDAAVAVAMPAAWSEAHALGPARSPVADEDVERTVGVAPHEVGGGRLKPAFAG